MAVVAVTVALLARHARGSAGMRRVDCVRLPADLGAVGIDPALQILPSAEQVGVIYYPALHAIPLLVIGIPLIRPGNKPRA